MCLYAVFPKARGVQEPVVPGSSHHGAATGRPGSARRAGWRRGRIVCRKAAFKTSIALQGYTTTLIGFAAVKLKNLKNLKNPRLPRDRPPLLFQTFNHP